jgi:methionyl-tRNA formyltransferase
VRIFLNGIGQFGLDTFEKLREAGHEIAAVAAPPKSLSGRPDRLFAAAEAAGIPALDTARLKEPEVAAQLRAANPELGVMAFVQEFISMDILNLPAKGTIQYHPSLLPRHRGRSSINWAIIKGEPFTGISIFWPDEGMDTGPVLLQRRAEIGPDATAGSLYYDTLYPIGLEMLVESVNMVAAGNAPKLVQDESEATYEKPAEGRLARIDWRRPTAEVYNLIRGCDPSPGAWTRFGDKILRVTDARPLPGHDGAPGVLASADGDGAIIGTADGAILVRKLQADGPAGPAAEVIAVQGIQPGTRFLNPSSATS